MDRIIFKIDQFQYKKSVSYIENITILTAIITGTSNLIETNVIIPPYIDYQGT